MLQFLSRFSFHRTCFIPFFVLMIAHIASLSSWSQENPPAEEPVSRLLNHWADRGGLAVCVGWNDSRWPVRLHQRCGMIVQGLVQTPEQRDRAREQVKRAGVHGNVSIALLLEDGLPYSNGIVNLLMLRDEKLLEREEAMRVLAPEGMLLVSTPGGWKTVMKPRPGEMDDWTHYLHGADNNAVSSDTTVGPPKSLRWITKLGHLRHHDFLASISVIVTDGVRLYSIEDDGPRMSIDLPSRWRLVARDAFNGIVLWEKPIASWVETKRGFRSGPLGANRRLVASAERLFVTLRFDGPVHALDPKTGNVLEVYDHTARADEILFSDGILYLVIDGGKKHDSASGKRIMAVDVESKAIVWENGTPAVRNTLAQTLTVGDEHLFLHNGKAMVCLDRNQGNIRWEKDLPAVEKRPSWSAPTTVYHKGVILCADRATEYPPQWEQNDVVRRWMTSHGGPAVVWALSAETGKILWSEVAAENFHAPVNLFVIDDLVWFGQSHNWWFGEATRPTLKKLGKDWYKEDPLAGRDIRTGKIKRRIHPGEVFTDSHHHRCYRGKATEKFILMGRTGVEFIDVRDDASHLQHHWIRGTCQYGILPANGLLYIPPHPCICYIESKLNGFFAFSAQEIPRRGDHFERLRKGSTSPPPLLPLEEEHAAWPTFRADDARSGFARTELAGPLKPMWKKKLDGIPTSPVMADGCIYLAITNRHTVHALEVDTGKQLWSFTAGGRVDSPPTYWRGRLYFGSADGHIYCLDGKEGELLWTFRAAPRPWFLPVEGQLESNWPIPGTILIDQGKLYATAGRSSYIDRGIFFVKLNAVTGTPLVIKNHYSRDRQTGKQPPEQGWEFGNNALELPGLLQDILVREDDTLFLRQVPLTTAGERLKQYQPHLFNPMGLLAKEWWHRGYTIYGERYYSGPFVWSDAGKQWPAGRVLVFDDRYVCGFGRKNPRGPGNRGYRLYGGAEKSPTNSGWTPQWEREIPILAYAMALAHPKVEGETTIAQKLLVAGPPKEALRSSEAAAGKDGGKLLVFNAQNGTSLFQCELPGIPVLDGMAVADGNVAVTQSDGTVMLLSVPR